MLKYFCIFWMGFTTVFFAPYAYALLLFGHDRSWTFIRGTWAKLMLWAPGGRLVVQGKEHCDPSRATVFVSNHQSTLDIPALLLAISPAQFRFVIKKVIRYVPLFGWYLVLAKNVFVDRASRRSTAETLDKAAQQIKNGTSILVFPEGTRSATGEVLPFKKAMFAIPLRAGVSICPVAIEGTRHIQPKNSWNVQPGEIRVNIGAPIDPAPFGEDREALAKHVREKVIALHREIGGLGGDLSNALDYERRPAGASRAAGEEAEA
ncbi:MAG: 1-acyl-sn-glycerol-3-phosphate acyltransferase [Myxococcaceae bacterium]|nr:1-acyl-sn-glycerol-3-phosphate acyltransferase [Myxococcaceae bacterium]